MLLLWLFRAPAIAAGAASAILVLGYLISRDRKKK